MWNLELDALETEQESRLWGLWSLGLSFISVLWGQGLLTAEL